MQALRTSVALSLFSVASGSACGKWTEPPAPAAVDGQVAVVGAERLAGARPVLRLRVANGTDAPAVVYRDVLSTRVDDRRTLTLVMHEVPRPPDGSSADCHDYVPRFATVPPRTTMAIDVDAPLVVRDSAAVKIELGWSDRSIADAGDTTKCRYEFERTLAAAERGVVTSRFAL